MFSTSVVDVVFCLLLGIVAELLRFIFTVSFAPQRLVLVLEVNGKQSLREKKKGEGG